MAWKTLKYRLTSDAPMLQHNGQSADPLNKWAKLKSQITSKRNKTDADQIELARLDFYSSLYLSEEGPIIPTHVIDGMVIAASKKSREGPMAKAGCYCPEHAILDYEGPRTADEMWNDESFRFHAMVKVNGSRVPRMRPIFNHWSAVISINVEDTLVNPTRVDEWMNIAGTQIGLCDWRPQYGRFTAERLNGK